MTTTPPAREVPKGGEWRVGKCGDEIDRFPCLTCDARAPKDCKRRAPKPAPAREADLLPLTTEDKIAANKSYGKICRGADGEDGYWWLCQTLAAHRIAHSTTGNALESTLFDAIAHGDTEHRAWLTKAIDDHFAGRPVERVQGTNGNALEILSDLSSYLGAGMGDESTTAEQFDKRIRWGIDHIGRVYRDRAAQVVEECSKRLKTTWGEVKRAILDDTALPTAAAPSPTTGNALAGELAGALEPLANMAYYYDSVEDDAPIDKLMKPTVGDARRARTAYQAARDAGIVPGDGK